MLKKKLYLRKDNGNFFLFLKRHFKFFILSVKHKVMFLSLYSDEWIYAQVLVCMEKDFVYSFTEQSLWATLLNASITSLFLRL